jgi:hypothetical protein
VTQVEIDPRLVMQRVIVGSQLDHDYVHVLVAHQLECLARKMRGQKAPAATFLPVSITVNDVALRCFPYRIILNPTGMTTVFMLGVAYWDAPMARAIICLQIPTGELSRQGKWKVSDGGACPKPGQEPELQKLMESTDAEFLDFFGLI